MSTKINDRVEDFIKYAERVYNKSAQYNTLMANMSKEDLKTRLINVCAAPNFRSCNNQRLEYELDQFRSTDKDNNGTINNNEFKIFFLKKNIPIPQQFKKLKNINFLQYLTITRNIQVNIRTLNEAMKKREAKNNKIEAKNNKIKAKSNNKKGVNFVNKPNRVPPLNELSKKINKNLTSARSIITDRASTVKTLTNRTELAATQRDISVTMSKIRGELMNEWEELYEKFKKMYKDSYIILNQQRISTEDFEIYLENPICKSQKVSQSDLNRFINLQGQTEQKEVLYKVNKIILLCRYVNELYCIIENFKDKLQYEQKTNVDKGIEELKKIIENLLKINTKGNTDTLNIDPICKNIKEILNNFKKVIEGIKSDLDVPFIKDNFKTIEIPNYMKSTNSKKTTPENKNVVNFKEILEQINKQDKDNNAINLLNYIKAEEEEFNLSKIVVGSNGQDIEKSKQYLEKILDFYSVYYKKNRPIIKDNREHQAFIQKLNNKLIDILNKDVILNIELLKYNFLDAEKVYAEIINEIKGKNTNRRKKNKEKEKKQREKNKI